MSHKNSQKVLLTPWKKKMDTFYRFHGTHGHLIDKFHELINQIESLIKEGKLRRLMHIEIRERGYGQRQEERSTRQEGWGRQQDDKRREVISS